MVHEIVVGAIASLIGLIALAYTILTLFKLKGGLRKGFLGIALGIFLGYASIISMFLFDLGYIPDETENLLVESFLGIASIAIALGSMRMFKVISYMPPAFFEKINKYL